MLKDRLIFLRTNTTMEYFMKYLFIFNQWLAHGIHSQQKFFKQGVFFFLIIKVMQDYCQKWKFKKV